MIGDQRIVSYSSSNHPTVGPFLPLSPQHFCAFHKCCDDAIPLCDREKIMLVRETKLLDSQVNEGDFGRYTNLAARMLKVST